MSDIVERKQWFERNKHLFSEGMQQRWLTCAYQDEVLIDELKRKDAEIEWLRKALADALHCVGLCASAGEFPEIKKARAALTASEAEIPAAIAPESDQG